MSLTANEQKQFKHDAEAKLSKASSPIEKLRFTCLSRGASGINGLSRQFKIMDDDGNRQLSKEEFKKGCKDFGANLTDKEIDSLFQEIDEDNSGSIAFDEFLQSLRPPMSKSRVELIRKCFELLDRTKDGVITPEDLKGVYNARNHPKYQNGEMSEEEVFKHFLKTFECKGDIDGKHKYAVLYGGLKAVPVYPWSDSIPSSFPVTWEEFMNYYSGISSSIDQDVYFDLMIRNAYKI